MTYSIEINEFLKCNENNLDCFSNFSLENDSNDEFLGDNINKIENSFLSFHNGEYVLPISNTATTADKTNKNQFIFLGKKKKKSRKYDEDSIKKKIINHYINFIVKFINIIIWELLKKNDMHFNYDLQFYNLDYKYKKKLYNTFYNLKIEDVIKTKKSSKYKKESYSNEEVCKIIKKEEKLRVVAEILEHKLLFFFEKIYEDKRKKKYNLKDFGLIDLEIDLPNQIELYEDLKEKGKKGEENHELYIERMNFYKNKLLKRMFNVENKKEA